MRGWISDRLRLKLDLVGERERWELSVPERQLVAAGPHVFALGLACRSEGRRFMNWRHIGLIGMGVVLTWSVAFAQAPRYNAQEQEALRIVNAWDQAWNQKDPQKILSYMADDLVAGDGRNVWKGKAELLDAYHRLNMSGITYEVVSEYAAGRRHRSQAAGPPCRGSGFRSIGHGVHRWPRQRRQGERPDGQPQAEALGSAPAAVALV
jgi:hypothetical protein